MRSWVLPLLALLSLGKAKACHGFGEAQPRKLWHGEPQPHSPQLGPMGTSAGEQFPSGPNPHCSRCSKSNKPRKSTQPSCHSGTIIFLASSALLGCHFSLLLIGLINKKLLSTRPFLNAVYVAQKQRSHCGKGSREGNRVCLSINTDNSQLRAICPSFGFTVIPNELTI